jgi:cell division protein FtsX
MVKLENSSVQIGALLGIVIGMFSSMFLDTAFILLIVGGLVFGGAIGGAWSRWRQR